MKLDFVFQSDTVENCFNFPFELRKRAIISWSQPFIFGFAPESFRYI
jgi:hypothetical protein